MANGLVVADTGISVGGRAVLGANLGRTQVGMITSTSDVVLATVAAGGTQIGSAVSMVVPAAGIIRVTVVDLELDETEGSAIVCMTFGVKVGSDSVLWATFDHYDGTSKYVGTYCNASVSSFLIENGFSKLTDGVNVAYAGFDASWDIVSNSVSTSTQDIECWCGDNANGNAGEATVTGTTVTTRFMVEIIDGS